MCQGKLQQVRIAKRVSQPLLKFLVFRHKANQVDSSGFGRRFRLRRGIRQVRRRQPV
jgi:hypothetical protein